MDAAFVRLEDHHVPAARGFEDVWPHDERQRRVADARDGLRSLLKQVLQ